MQQQILRAQRNALRQAGSGSQDVFYKTFHSNLPFMSTHVPDLWRKPGAASGTTKRLQEGRISGKGIIVVTY